MEFLIFITVNITAQSKLFSYYLVHLSKIQRNLKFLICYICVQDASYSGGDYELQ